MSTPDRTDVHRRRRRERVQAQRGLRMFTRRLTYLFAALPVLILAGTAAFSITEGTSVGYSFAWTMDTMTTLGSIHNPPDGPGRVVVVFLELLGIGTLFYGLATVAEFFVSGQLSGLLD